MSNELKGPVRLTDSAVTELVDLRDGFVAEMKRIDDEHEKLEQLRTKVKQEYSDAAFTVARNDADLPDDAHFAIDQQYLDQGIAIAKPCPHCGGDTGSFRPLGDILSKLIGVPVTELFAAPAEQEDDGDDTNRTAN